MAVKTRNERPRALPARPTGANKASTTLKDPRSLSQALFDTPTVKSLYHIHPSDESRLLSPGKLGTDARCDQPFVVNELQSDPAHLQEGTGQRDRHQNLPLSLPEPAILTDGTWARFERQDKQDVWANHLEGLIQAYGGQANIPSVCFRQEKEKVMLKAENVLKHVHKRIWHEQLTGLVAAAMPIHKGTDDLGHPEPREDYRHASECSQTVPNGIQYPQTLSHFSEKNVKALMRFTRAKDGQLLKDYGYRSSFGVTMPGGDPFDIHADSAASIGPALSFAYQSMYYVLSTPQALLSSFQANVRDGNGNKLDVPITFNRMVQCFHWLRKLERNAQIIFPNLKRATRSLYTPSTSNQGRKNVRRLQRAGLPCISPELYYVKNEQEAAHIAHTVFAALVASIPPFSARTWALVQDSFHNGRMSAVRKCDPLEVGALQSVLDAFDNEIALDLLSSFVKALSTRISIDKMSKEKDPTEATEFPWVMRHAPVIKLFWDGLLAAEAQPFGYSKIHKDTIDVELRWAYDVPPYDRSYDEDGPDYIYLIIQWLKILIVKEWDGKAEIDRFSTTGASLEILWWSHVLLHEDYNAMYQIPHLAARLDPTRLDTKWLTTKWRTNPRPLLHYPFILSLSAQVCCFRGMNYAMMFKAYNDSVVASRLLAQMSLSETVSGRGDGGLHQRLGDILQSYFVIEVRRGHVLEDAMDQLWRCEKRELMKPLKVRMGMYEGEEGLDHGGVQQEFFRIAIAEAFDPKYGFFSITDEQSGMMWFRPCSPEPLWKYEMLGLLFSLAVYNGLTLPVNLPEAFYVGLGGPGVITTPGDISDGWPVLAKGLQSLLDWSDGDVANVFARSYEYTIEMPGRNITIDMQRIGRKDRWMPAHLFPESASVACQCGACSSLPDCAAHIIRRCHVIKPGVTAWVDVKDMPFSSPAPITSTSFEKTQAGEKEPLSREIASAETSSKESPITATSSKEISKEDHSESLDQEVGIGICTNAYSSPRQDSPNLSSQPGMVTDGNREQYVSDYIYWLTKGSICREFDAFANGFFTCIARRAPVLLEIRDYKLLVEGTQDIKVEDLQRIASYEGGWNADHRTVRAFWRTVENFSPRQLKLLMEFVTASDRLPITGMRNMPFSLQKNGDSDDRLPTSLTCYGKLLLPAYSSQEVLEEKLCIAIENSKGFGVA
ncbi:MAG: hypothetical protein Q9220_000557 [cf. Caloplaca sp. 1 TL-2023]